jgi:hypothetical protein
MEANRADLRLYAEGCQRFADLCRTHGVAFAEPSPLPRAA